MTTHSSVLAWRIPGTGEPGRLQSMWPHRVGHERSDLAVAVAVAVAVSTFWPMMVGLRTVAGLCHLANVLQRAYSEAQGLLEVESSAMMVLVDSNWFLSWLCHSFKMTYGYVILPLSSCFSDNCPEWRREWPGCSREQWLQRRQQGGTTNRLF